MDTNLRQELLVDSMQRYLVFNRPLKSEEISEYNSFNVLPNNPRHYDPDTISEWQSKMLCYKASNGNINKFKEFYEHTDYADVFEFFVLSSADKV